VRRIRVPSKRWKSSKPSKYDKYDKYDKDFPYECPKGALIDDEDAKVTLKSCVVEEKKRSFKKKNDEQCCNGWVGTR
jgi:hypothetical protein